MIYIFHILGIFYNFEEKCFMDNSSDDYLKLTPSLALIFYNETIKEANEIDVIKEIGRTTKLSNYLSHSYYYDKTQEKLLNACGCRYKSTESLRKAIVAEIHRQQVNLPKMIRKEYLSHPELNITDRIDLIINKLHCSKRFIEKIISNINEQ
jgi:hypothetical protein